jgi:nucleotide-binding universal stress UspA family protein
MRRKEERIMTEIGKILVPYDLSDDLAKILPYVRSLAAAYGSKICLLHVVHDLRKWGKAYVPHVSMDMFQKDAESEAEKSMDRLCEEQLAEFDNIEKKIVSGDAAGEILKAVDSTKADLVILGTHGRKGLEHMLMGSVAEKVVKGCSVPVMTVDPEKIE